MTAEITQLQDREGNNIYPIAGAAVEHSITRSMLQEGVFEGETMTPLDDVVFVNTGNIADGAVTASKLAASAFIDLFYPVGSYYETSDTTFNPNVMWGGTWVEDSKGRITVSRADSGTFATVGGTGGSETVTISSANLPKHTHTYSKSNTPTAAATGNTGSTTLTNAQLPKLTGTLDFHGSGWGKPANNVQSVSGVFSGTSYNQYSGFDPNPNTGSTSVPKITFSIGNNQGHTHTLNSHTHVINFTSTNSGDGGFANSALNNLQPYIVVKRWHRIS